VGRHALTAGGQRQRMREVALRRPVSTRSRCVVHRTIGGRPTGAPPGCSGRCWLRRSREGATDSGCSGLRRDTTAPTRSRSQFLTPRGGNQ